MTPNPLSLHHLTVLDASPVELVSIAAELACPYACVFTQVEEPGRALFTPVEGPVTAEVARRCADTGVSIYNIEYFPVDPGFDPERYRRGFETGAALGARSATAHINDPDVSRGLAGFARVCEIAAEYNIQVGLEFTGFAAVKTLAQAAETIRAAAQPNARIVLDCLHLFRNQGSVAEVAAVDPALFGYIQICDGPLHGDPDGYFAEAIEERQIPGTGQFPLRDLIARLPGHPPIDVEVPLTSLRRAGFSPLERARRAMEGTRRLLG